MTLDLEERPIRYVAETPYWVRKANSTSAWNGTAYAHRKYCDSGGTNCDIVEEVKVIISVDERDTSDPNDFGVVTQYCVGHDPVCPSWVKHSLTNAYEDTH